MIATLFIVICRVAVLRKFLNLFIYQALAKHFRTEDWLFMNYGYDSDALRRNKIPLSKEEEAHRYHIQLYQHLCSAVPLDGKDVLEIGSGRGGGAFYMKRYLKPRSVIGVDYSNNAVALCRKRYNIDGLSFVTGDAEKLALSDNTFDVVVNIESSHGYRSMETFLSEVKRLLKPGGYFLFADIRGKIYVDYAVLRQQFIGSGLILLKEEDITNAVLEAMDADKERKEELIRRHVPKLLRYMFYEFAGLPGSFIYDSFRLKDSTYHCCVLQKPSHLRE
ncbi:MAG: class I SAM-dependent methyltransferase [Acidobacteria bacterium]|nr:class I SAM-dependent methyltransferase [Acidobacteriota bacterium]